MLRRPPTSIELKLDDIREYEQIRQQMAKEQEKKSMGGGGNNEPLNLPTGPKSKEEIYSRIGYVPPDKGKPAQTLPHLH